METGTILGWLADPPAGRGLRFADGADGWSFLSYERLAGMARRAAWQLRAVGVGPGDIVPVVCPTSPAFVAAFYGALLLGATPCAVVPPSAYTGDATYPEHVRRVVRLVRAQVLVATPEVATVLSGVAAELGCVVVPGVADAGAMLAEPAPPPELAMVQFSSGSTGPQRGVTIPYAALLANIAAIRQWLSYDERDGMVSWLPMHHDMGLVGCLLMPVATGGDIWLMRPEQFIRSPIRWLRVFGDSSASTAVTPTFGLVHLLRRVRPDDLSGVDLSGWRTLIVGAEPVAAEVLDRVCRLLAPAGFAAGSVLPAYGLAEATLAVTGRRHGEHLRTMTADPASLRLGHPVLAGTVTLVGCGRPLPDVRVDVVDGDGRPVPDGVLGEVEVRGPSVASGYVTDTGEGRFDGVIRTGDAGFLRDGELFVVGRLGDSVKVLGRWLFAEDLERVAVSMSPRPGRTTVLLGDLAGRPTAVVAIESDAVGAAAAIGRAVANLAAGARVLVLAVPRGWIALTTSGKPRRRAMWQRVLAGHPEGARCWDSGQTAGPTGGEDRGLPT